MRFIKVVIIIGSFCVASCTTVPKRSPKTSVDVGHILDSIDFGAINISAIESALPRFSSLREGVETARIRGIGEDTLKKILIVGATLNKVVWDCDFYFRGEQTRSSLDSFTYSTELNLTIISHRLNEIGAERSLIREIDSLNSCFEAWRDLIPGPRELEDAFEDLDEKIKCFLDTMTDEDECRSVSYQFGKWLVDEALLSSLCVGSSIQRDRKILMSGMNNKYDRDIRIDRVVPIIDNIPTPRDSELRKSLMDTIIGFKKIFYVRNIGEVKKVKNSVNKIFEIYDIRFL